LGGVWHLLVVATCRRPTDDAESGSVLVRVRVRGDAERVLFPRSNSAGYETTVYTCRIHRGGRRMLAWVILTQYVLPSQFE